MKRKTYFILWGLLLGLCFLFWIASLVARLFQVAFSKNPVAVLFYPELHQYGAVAAGYGEYAWVTVLLSLMDIRFWLLIFVLVLGLVTLVIRGRKSREQVRKQEQECQNLNQQIIRLQGMLNAQEKDAMIRLETAENLAHQLKSSLNSLWLRMELSGMNEQLEETLNHMNSQLEGFLNISTVHYNDRQLCMELVSLKEIIVQEVMPELSGYTGELDMNMMSGWLYGDRQMLRQAVETLLVNALRHSNQVTVLLTETATGLCLEIRNRTSGTSLPPEKRYASREPGHYGIGLDLARTAAREHLGKLTLSLENGVFAARLCLPVHPWETPDCNVSEKPD